MKSLVEQSISREGEARLTDAAKPLTTGQCATLACLWEVSVPKPGNVHRGADFEDLTFYDFVNSAVAIGPAMDEAAKRGVGQTVLDAVLATRAAVATNTNLGTILLLAPLAVAASLDASEDDLRERAAKVLGCLNADDAAKTYEAIRAAQPGGMGEVDDMDVAAEAPADLMEAMQAARDRDLVARQYSDNYEQIFTLAIPNIEAGLAAGWSLVDSVIHTHLRLMAEWPDSLIARKCGSEVAAQSARRAAAVLEAGTSGENNYQQALSDLDFWLRSDGHRRNPGTAADMIATSLFVMLREGRLAPSSMKVTQSDAVRETGETT